MSQALWRIATDAPTYTADDMAGTGAEMTGGRWNRIGTPVLYSSTSRALACLETVVHLNAGGLPLNRYLVQIDVPDPIWTAAERQTSKSLPVGWDAEPAGLVSIRLGEDWLASKRSAILFVPSVVVEEEFNALINPAHPEAPRISARKMRRWSYDPRLIK